ncbi:MAG: quinoprotein relay system zinc metallohydrolase 1 [Pseudomonadota bacterium]
MSLTRRAALGTLAAGLTTPALPQARNAYKLEPKPIGPGLWMVEGATDDYSQQNGGAIVNSALLEGEAGLIVVDTGPTLGYGAALRAVAETVSGKRIAEVVVTHHHPDHSLGSKAFADLPIRALPRTRALTAIHGPTYVANLERVLGDWMEGTEVVPPDSDLDAGRISIAGREFQAMALSGHTEADLVLLDIASGVLIAGDLVFLNRAPTTPDAHLAQWHQSLSELQALEAAAILPGHGPLDWTGESIRQTRAYLDWLEATIRAAAAEGLDMVEVMDLQLPSGFATLGAQPDEFHRSVIHLFPEIEREILPRLD